MSGRPVTRWRTVALAALGGLGAAAVVIGLLLDLARRVVPVALEDPVESGLLLRRDPSAHPPSRAAMLPAPGERASPPRAGDDADDAEQQARRLLERSRAVNAIHGTGADDGTPMALGNGEGPPADNLASDEATRRLPARPAARDEANDAAAAEADLPDPDAETVDAGRDEPGSL